MLISLNEIKQLVNINLDDAELLKLIGSRLVEIESVEDLALKYKKIYVVKVKKTEPIEGTHLSLCQIDAGEKLNSEVDPEHENYVQVVCGAPNVREGMVAAWVAPGAVVPATFGTPDPFEISARPLRGFMSFGMLAGADELALGDDHSGLLELDPRLTPGDLFASAYGLNDKILEVENKSLTHRPDCFGLIGFAREVAGILGQPFKEPDFYHELPAETSAKVSTLKSATTAELTVDIESPDLCPRYSCAVFDLPDSWKTRPSYLTNDDVFLYKAGMRPISPLVDLTNRLMLETGQPLHAFDYEKFLAVGETPRLGVRLARKGETLTLLDDRDLSLTENDIVITASDIPVALAGAMGGKSTEIDDSTKTVLLESASFSLYHLRKTQMSHGIFSEAITRFTKGQPAAAAPVVLDEALSRLKVSPKLRVDVVPTYEPVPPSPALADLIGTSSLPELPPEPKKSISVSPEEINAILGSAYSEDLIIKTLKNVGFSVIKNTADSTKSANSTNSTASTESKTSSLEVTPPFWRTDIKIKEDLAEEIGRLLGFDNLPLTFPTRPFIAPSLDPMLKLKSAIRRSLSGRLGLNEILTYSFVSDDLLKKANLDPENCYKIVNSLSPDLERFRPSLLPSLLDKFRLNQKANYHDFALYELNQVSQKPYGLTPEGTPSVKTALALVLPGDFYAIKSLFLELARDLTLNLPVEFILKPFGDSHLLEPRRALAVYLKSGDLEILIGSLGEVKSSVRDRFKVSGILSALEIILDPCFSVKSAKKSEKSLRLSKYPAVSRDLTLKLPVETPFATVETALESAIDSLEKAENLDISLEPLSIFHKPNEKTKNLSFRLTLRNPEKTFASDEVSVIMEKIINHLSALGAEVV